MRIEGTHRNPDNDRRPESVSGPDEAKRLQGEGERPEQAREVAPNRRVGRTEDGDRPREGRQEESRATTRGRDQARISEEGLRRLKGEQKAAPAKESSEKDFRPAKRRMRLQNIKANQAEQVRQSERPAEPSGEKDFRPAKRRMRLQNIKANQAERAARLVEQAGEGFRAAKARQRIQDIAAKKTEPREVGGAQQSVRADAPERSREHDQRVERPERSERPDRADEADGRRAG